MRRRGGFAHARVGGGRDLGAEGELFGPLLHRTGGESRRTRGNGPARRPQRLVDGSPSAGARRDMAFAIPHALRLFRGRDGQQTRGGHEDSGQSAGVVPRTLRPDVADRRSRRFVYAGRGAEAEADDDQYISTDITDDEDEQRININLELGGDAAEQEDYEITDTTAEPGTASVSSKTKTDGSDSADKVFYNFTTKEGETLYLVIDQARGTDNVYLLDTVSLGDLKVMADGQTSSYGADEEGEDNLLSALTSSTNDEEDIISEQNTKKSGRSPLNSNVVIVLIFAVVGGGAYYYLKVYKNKKDEAMDAMDAMDMDEFEPEEEEEDLEFDYDDAEKERYLDELINEDDSLYDTDPEEYATSHIDEEDYDAGIELDDDEPDINEDDEEAEE